MIIQTENILSYSILSWDSWTLDEPCSYNLSGLPPLTSSHFVYGTKKTSILGQMTR